MAKVPPRAPLRARSELSAAIDACRSTFWAVGLFSALANILMLTGAMFMLEIYDRVLPSRSVSTLLALLLLAAGLYGGLAVLDIIRGRVMVRIGGSLDEAVRGRVYDAIVRTPLLIGISSDGVQHMCELERITH